MLPPLSTRSSSVTKIKYSYAKAFFRYSSSQSSDQSSSALRYRFPLALFMIFEATNPIVWYSEKDTKFDYYILTNPSSLKGIMLYFKKHLFTGNNYMLDVMFFENNIENLSLSGRKLNYSGITGVWSLYLYNQRVRVHLITTTDNCTSLASIDAVYQNAN